MPFDKLNVVEAPGAGNSLGYITPAVGMVTELGEITAVDGAVVTISPGFTFYAGLLNIYSGNLFAHGWDSGVNVINFKETADFSDNKDSGVYHNGSKVHFFTF